MDRSSSATAILFLLFSSLLSLNVFSEGDQDEIDALLQFKDGVTDPNNVLLNWDRSLSACDWPRVLCYHGYSVSNIDLGKCGLSGYLSSSLSALHSLKFLNLAGNDLSGQIPSDLGKLTNLKEMDLSSNKLTGSIPESFRHLTSLQVLSLDHNALSGQVPWSLTSGFQNIRKLNCMFNQLSGKLPCNWTNKAITPASFQFNKFSDLTCPT